MKPKINSTSFGSITVKNKIFDYDILIRRSRQIEKRKKKLSKKIYGTSHKISLAEAKYIYEKGAKKIIIGTGQTGYVELSKKARKFFKERDCKTKLLPTPKAIKLWNRSKGKIIAMFHITC
ncbi:MAG TPA: MTH938/NDUFAF3 family protein [Methanosarcina sp.]